MTITFPKEPNPKQYEDFVAACLTAHGYFTETRLVLRIDSREVLELDVVATPSGDNFPTRMIVEAKSGYSGLRDIFTLYGWMQYLDINKGSMVHLNPSEDDGGQGAFAEVCGRTNITCSRLSPDMTDFDFNKIGQASNMLSNTQRVKLILVGWYRNIAQRIAYSEFIHRCKTVPDPEMAKARNYERSVIGSFFAPAPILAASRLYEAYQASPNLVGEMESYLAEKNTCAPQVIWNKVENTNEYLWLQYLMFLEHRARLSIIKNALHHKIDPENPRILKEWKDMYERIMPDNFRQGIEKIHSHKHALRIPYLLQLFIELFGGFHFPGPDEDLLATISSIPKEDISECLDFMDYFFPFEKKWFFTRGTMKAMKLIPGYLHGTGCFLRFLMYGLQRYEDGFDNEIAGILSEWHSALYNTLQPELGIGQ